MQQSRPMRSGQSRGRGGAACNKIILCSVAALLQSYLHPGRCWSLPSASVETQGGAAVCFCCCFKTLPRGLAPGGSQDDHESGICSPGAGGLWATLAPLCKLGRPWVCTGAWEASGPQALLPFLTSKHFLGAGQVPVPRADPAALAGVWAAGATW